MIQVENVNIKGNDLQYIKIDMWGAPLVMIKGKKGYVMCGYLNIATADKLGDFAVRVTGVKDLDSVLASKVVECSAAASRAGIKQGDPVSEIAGLL